MRLVFNCAGSRSSALTLAVAMHPRARVTTCIDERSLAFWALGHARATGSVLSHATYVMLQSHA